MSAPLLGVSLLRIGTVLRLERVAVVNGQGVKVRQATKEYPPLPRSKKIRLNNGTW